MKITLIAFILLILFSCDSLNEHDLYGYYIPENYKNNYDTVHIKQNGIYHRKVYDKNKKLVLEMNGSWSYQAPNGLNLNDFYLNLDDDLMKYPDLLKDTNHSISTYFQNDNLGIKFCAGYYKNQNCYRKLK